MAGDHAGAAQDTSARYIPDDQQLIYTAQLTVRAKNVGAALSTATSIVTAAGGYVSAENSSGAGAGQPASSATATVTLKIPAAVYPATLARLTGTGLGTQLSLQQQAQDVTQQVADVSSLVASDQAAITQLRALLKDAGSVGDLLSVQDQINAETSDLEAMLAQQQALDHQTAYATVTLTLVGPKAVVKAKAKQKPAPPPGLASGLTGGWRAFRLTDRLAAGVHRRGRAVRRRRRRDRRRRVVGPPPGRAPRADPGRQLGAVGLEHAEQVFPVDEDDVVSDPVSGGRRPKNASNALTGYWKCAWATTNVASCRDGSYQNLLAS